MGCTLCVNAEGNGMFWYFYHGLSGAAYRSDLWRSDKHLSQRHRMSLLPHMDKSVATKFASNNHHSHASSQNVMLFHMMSIIKWILLDINIDLQFEREQIWAYWNCVRRVYSCTLLCLTNVVSGLALSRQIALSITSLVLEWAWIWDCQAEWQAGDGR